MAIQEQIDLFEQLSQKVSELNPYIDNIENPMDKKLFSSKVTTMLKALECSINSLQWKKKNYEGITPNVEENSNSHEENLIQD